MRAVEFFQDGDGYLSMTRLLAFVSFFPASYVLVESQTDTALGLYLGAYVAQMVGGKYSDAYMKKASNVIPAKLSKK